MAVKSYADKIKFGRPFDAEANIIFMPLPCGGWKNF